MSTEEEVRRASLQFYDGLNRMANGNIGPLTDIWSHSAAVMTMHPIGGRQVGWEAVRGSFEKVAQLASDGSVEIADQLIQIDGNVAFEVGVERGKFKLAGNPIVIEQRVTNVYRREAGAWKIVHHHTDISPAMVETLNRVQASAGQARR
jgi:ketosteroid isomerase-like protein